jgi:flagella basal body P-ring formation protein FlgA
VKSLALAVAAAALGGLLSGPPPALAGEGDARLSVELRAAARSAGAFVRLDEVAILRGARAPEAGAVLLGRAPEAGRDRIVAREAVERRLAEEGFEPGSFTVAGAKESRVAAAAEEGSPAPDQEPEKEAPAPEASPRERLADLVAERARSAVAEVLRCAAADVEARLEFAAEPAAAAPSAFEVRWAGGKPRLGRQRLEVVPAAGKAGDAKPAPVAVILADLAVRRDALVAVRDLAPGEPVAAADVRRARISTLDAAADFVKDASELVGKAPARGVRAGAPLDRRALAKLILVRRGQPVTLVSECGPVRITETAVARSDGGLDDVILVERMDNRRQLAGRVAGSGLVKTE